MNDLGKVCRGMKRVCKCRSFGMNAKRRFYEGIVVPIALLGTETWNMRAAKKRELNMMGMRYLYEKYVDREKNQEVQRRTGCVIWNNVS